MTQESLQQNIHDIPQEIGELPKVQSAVEVYANKIANIVLSDLSTSLLRCKPDLDKYSLSFAQYFLLQKIEDTPGGITMTKIAQLLGQTSAATTGQVDRLENLGYVARRHPAEDLRKIIVSITPLGSIVRRSIDKKLHAQIAELLGME